ncbi:hypothetical protein [uncultured Roseovarius sp.]|uniref:hypothetical protein n=1 Tax=uncultured Roseovarius sp. TaxID=293344 RepID=UPI002639EA61|nr:hypothetical protein [uncultured Roseovarius sp.]
MTDIKTKPPSNTIRIMRVADLPPDRNPAQYEIQNGDDKPKVVTLMKRQRQMMDLLIAAPVYCASPVRLSDVVHILKREIGLEVETKFYPGNPITGAGAYGVYFLTSQVCRLPEQKVAA